MCNHLVAFPVLISFHTASILVTGCSVRPTTCINHTHIAIYYVCNGAKEWCKGIVT